MEGGGRCGAEGLAVEVTTFGVECDTKGYGPWDLMEPNWEKAFDDEPFA